MATERLSMRKTREILRQRWELGRTHREIAASVGQSLGAVAMTVGRAQAAGLDWPATQALNDTALEETLYGAYSGHRDRPIRAKPITSTGKAITGSVAPPGRSISPASGSSSRCPSLS